MLFKGYINLYIIIHIVSAFTTYSASRSINPKNRTKKISNQENSFIPKKKHPSPTNQDQSFSKAKNPFKTQKKLRKSTPQNFQAPQDVPIGFQDERRRPRGIHRQGRRPRRGAVAHQDLGETPVPTWGPWCFFTKQKGEPIGKKTPDF